MPIQFSWQQQTYQLITLKAWLGTKDSIPRTTILVLAKQEIKNNGHDGDKSH